MENTVLFIWTKGIEVRQRTMHLFNAMKYEEIRVVPEQSVEIKIKRQHTSKLSSKEFNSWM